jgi:hypothetical protein
VAKAKANAKAEAKAKGVTALRRHCYSAERTDPVEATPVETPVEAWP